jgi:hypothetical protein
MAVASASPSARSVVLLKQRVAGTLEPRDDLQGLARSEHVLSYRELVHPDEE